MHKTVPCGAPGNTVWFKVHAISNNILGPGLQEGCCPVQKRIMLAVELYYLAQQVVMWYYIECFWKIPNNYISLNFAVPKGQKGPKE